MSISVSVPTMDTSGSALRYGLLDVKPVEVREIVKKCGLKFRRVTRKFEPVKTPKSFEEMVRQENEAIFAIIEIPERFDAQKLTETYSNRSIQHYEEDAELKEAVVRLRESERKNRPLTSFVQFMKQRFESKKDHYLELEADRFLNSNLPLSFYNKFVVFDNTYYYFVEILENIVRRYESRASVARNFRMHGKIIKDMQRKVAPILDQIDTCFFSYSCLKKYVSIWNSRDYKEVLDPQFLDIERMDSSQFEKLSRNFDQKLRVTREFLLNFNPDMLYKEFDPTDHTKQIFAKLAMLPSDAFHLES